MPRYTTTPMCDGELLAAFEPTARPTDVFVATAAKSGQTWLLALLHHLRTGGDPDFGGKGAMGVTPWLEIPRDMSTDFAPYDRAERLAALASLPDPRVFKMHVTYDEVPRPSDSPARIINIARDPRDLAWSMHCHLKGLRPEALGGTPFDVPFDTWFEDWLAFGYAFQVAASFWPHRDDPRVLMLRYEDLQRDLAGEARRLVAFLGWSVDEATLTRSVELASLASMKENEAALGVQGTFNEGHRFVREGGMGKNRARLSADQERRIVEKARATLDPACFDWIMALGVD